ncbi:MAG: uracil phosphoribosyltransferase [Anaerofustis sp.]
MSNVMIFDHPLIQHKIGIIRDENTTHKLFRELVSEIAMLMAYEVTRDLPMTEVEINTPICKTTVRRLQDDKISIVPILRAGLGMVDGMLNLLPNAKVGHIGLYRDHETLQPVPYYCKLPEEISTNTVIVLDPMLATGGSGIAAINFLKEKGAKSIKFMCLIASEMGISKMKQAHPDVDIYAAAFDEKMNDKMYIVPGLGDAGDRLFGTK